MTTITARYGVKIMRPETYVDIIEYETQIEVIEMGWNTPIELVPTASGKVAYRVSPRDLPEAFVSHEALYKAWLDTPVGDGRTSKASWVITHIEREVRDCLLSYKGYDKVHRQFRERIGHRVSITFLDSLVAMGADPWMPPKIKLWIDAVKAAERMRP